MENVENTLDFILKIVLIIYFLMAIHQEFNSNSEE